MRTLVISMSLFSRITAVATAWSAAFAAPVLACPACFQASAPGTRMGYYVSAAILSLTPLLIMGVGVSYVAFKRSRLEKRTSRNTPRG